MKSIKLATLAILTGLTVGAVFAQDTQTRAEVRKEGAQARKAGETGASPEAGSPAKSAKSTKTKAEVRAEEVKSVKEGKLTRGTEANPPRAEGKSTRARSEVTKERTAAAKAGQRSPQGN